MACVISTTFVGRLAKQLAMKAAKTFGLLKKGYMVTNIAEKSKAKQSKNL